MNKLLYAALAAAATLGFSACSSEEPIGIGDGSGNVTIVAKLPAELGTRAYSDGTSATQLKYYVYEQGQTTPVIVEENAKIDITATVNLNLVKGNTYEIVFWAQDPTCKAYQYDQEARTITVDYNGVLQNDESRDAFYCMKTVTVAGGGTQTAELYRPFAQVNFGTSDANEAAVVKAYGENLSGLKSQLVVGTTLPNVLNCANGTVSGEQQVSFGLNGVPQDETFPAGAAGLDPIFDGYEYVAMDYVLCGKERSVIDLTLDIYAGNSKKNTLSVPNAPVQANYQTNIYGKLLTSTENFNVVIIPAFTGIAANIEVWDGTAAQPVVDETTKTVTINNAAQLAGFAQNVNNGNSYAGYTVKLTDDIDLNNQPWTPIGPNSDSQNKFKGTFDGQGYTISRMNVRKNNVYESAGLFGSLNGTVRNLNITNSFVSLNSSGESSDNGAGFIAGAIYNTGLIENCNVSNSTLECNRYGGGIVGYSSGSANGNTVMSCNISAALADESADLNDKVGGIVGYSDGGSGTYKDNRVVGCSLLAYRNVGGIAGCVNGGNTVTGNTVSETSITYTSPEGTTNSDSGGQSNGEIVGRNINASVSDNAAENVTIGKMSNVSGYNGLTRDADGAVHAGTPQGLASLHDYIKSFKGSFNETVKLDADINASGMTWEANWKGGGHPFTFDGQGHTISNLTLVNGMFTGVGGSATENAYVQNITFKNCNTTGGWCGTVWGYMYGNVVFNNVHVDNCTVSGEALVGGMVGGYGEGNGADYGATFNNCSVTNTSITSQDNEYTKAGASQFVGFVDYFMANEVNKAGHFGTKYIKFGEGNRVYNNTCNNPAGMIGGGIYVIGWVKNEGAIKNITFDLTNVNEFLDNSVTEPTNP